MRRQDRTIDGYGESKRAANEAAADMETVCVSLADQFYRFAINCGPAISEMKDRLKASGSNSSVSEARNPEQIIFWDVMCIGGTFAERSGKVPYPLVFLCTAINVAVMSGNVDPEMVNNAELQNFTFSSLQDWKATGVGETYTLILLAGYDAIYGTRMSLCGSLVFSELVVAAKLAFQSSCEDPSASEEARNVAEEYMALIGTYAGTTNSQSDPAPDADRHSCRECEEAYRRLELRFGADIGEVKSAQRELAKNLHPDVWANKRGVQGAEEQLKQINAACDHLANCRRPVNPASKKDEGKRQAEVSVDNGRDLYYEKGRARWAQYVENGKRLVNEQQAKESPSPRHTRSSDYVDLSRSPSYEPDPKIDADSRNAVSGGNNDPRFWRIARILLRMVWRTTKIILAILLASIAAAIVLLGIFMALWEYWEGQSRAKSGQSSLGSVNGRLFSFLESVTWLPREIWGGLMLVATLLFFGIVLAGQSIGQFASSNSTACMVVLFLSGLGLMAWVLQKEWQAEFSPSPNQKAPTTSSSVMGFIVMIAFIGGCGWWILAHRLASPEQAGATTSISATPTVQVNPGITSTGPRSGDRQLLWDYTREEQTPELPEEMKQKLKELIGPVTHHEDDMSFGPELIGAFYSDQPPGSQKVYSVTLPWIDIDGRSHAEGDLSFIVVATGDQLDVYKDQYAGKILSLVRSPGAGVDLMLIEYEWSGQGEDQKYLRILSVADRSLKLVTDVGMGLIDDYASAQPLGEVADRIYYRSETDGSITILSREHFLRQGGSPKELGVDSDSADKAFGRLLNRTKLDPKPTEAPLTPPSTATTPVSAADASQKLGVVQAIRKSCENGFTDSCASLARLYGAGDLANQPAAPATQSATNDSVTSPAVLVEVVPAISHSGTVMVQVAAVSTQEVADIEVAALKRQGFDVVVRHEPQDKLLHVQIGPFADRKYAEAMRQRVLADGFNATVK